MENAVGEGNGVGFLWRSNAEELRQFCSYR